MGTEATARADRTEDPLRGALQAMWSAAAPSWAEHAQYVDTRGQLVTRELLAAVALLPGERVLELGCGPGGVGLAAAKEVAPDGHVLLSDIAPEMVATAAKRAEAIGLTNVSTAVLDLEQIDQPDGSFDAVLCREAIMLVVDPVRAASEARRVLRTGGRAAFAVWGPRERNPWLGVLFEAVTAETGMPVPPPGLPGPFSLDRAGALERVLIDAGFTGVTTVEVTAPFPFASFDQWWRVVPALAGPLAQVLAGLPAGVQEGIRSRAESALASYITADGCEVPGVTIVGSARR